MGSGQIPLNIELQQDEGTVCCSHTVVVSYYLSRLQKYKLLFNILSSQLCHDMYIRQCTHHLCATPPQLNNSTQPKLHCCAVHPLTLIYTSAQKTQSGGWTGEQVQGWKTEIVLGKHFATYQHICTSVIVFSMQLEWINVIFSSI